MMRFLNVSLVVICLSSTVFGTCLIDDGRDDLCPIVINFANGTYRLTGADSPVQFDFYGIGQLVQMGWTAAGSNAAFLCRDKNRNGMIDDGTELFGNATAMSNGSRAGNGFVALAQFDGNSDGVIDDQDQIWSDLLLWRDRNHDAVSQPDEIADVADSGLAAISLDHHWNGRLDSSGNVFRYKAKVWIAEGSGQATPRPVYDIFFVSVP